jgi:hypothetical protein
MIMEYINQATAALAPLGLTVGGLLTAIGTVIASFLAAKFGASEPKRQYAEKTRLQRLVAAGELIQILHKFQDELQEIIYDCVNFKSSGGHAGAERCGFGKTKLRGDPHKLAALLGTRVVEDVILLMATYARATASVSGLLEFTDPSTASEDLEKWSAALILKTFELINKINLQAGLRISAKPSMGYEKLIEIAGDRAGDDEYTNLMKY